MFKKERQEKTRDKINLLTYPVQEQLVVDSGEVDL